MRNWLEAKETLVKLTCYNIFFPLMCGKMFARCARIVTKMSRVGEMIQKS